MPLGIPSVELLRDTFRRTVRQALRQCEETHPGHFQSRCRSVRGAPWGEIGPNVQAIQVSEAEFLVRGSWQFIIDPRAKGQFETAQAQIREMASLLASTVPHGETVKATFDFPPTETVANGQRLACSCRGVVRGQMSRSAAA